MDWDRFLSGFPFVADVLAWLSIALTLAGIVAGGLVILLAIGFVAGKAGGVLAAWIGGGLIARWVISGFLFILFLLLALIAIGWWLWWDEPFIGG